MSRARKTHKNLPPGLHVKRGDYFYYRSPDKKNRRFVGIGRVGREAAIKQWVKITGHREEPATGGTVAEILDRYITEEVPLRVRRGKLAQKTADGYVALAPAVRKEFGGYKYAKTPAESTRHDVLRTLEVDAYMRRFEGERGEVQANRQVSLLSGAFTFAQRAGICTYNPCHGAEKNEEDVTKRPISPQLYKQLVDSMRKPMRLIATLSDLTTLRKTDILTLRLSDLTPEEIIVKPSKTRRPRGKNKKAPPPIAYARTPAIEAVLEEAKTLPGRKISLFVFPSKKGTPYAESSTQTEWNRAKARAGLKGVKVTFKDIRTTEINRIKKAGGNATEAAGHADKRTTAMHYEVEATKVTPRR